MLGVQITRSTLQRVAIWTISTLGAAILGGTITLVYSSARPTFELVDIRPSLSVNEHFVTDKTEVPVSPDFRRLLEKTDWVSLLQFREQSINYSAFIEGLNNTEERMKRYRRAAPNFSNDYKNLKDILDKEKTTDEDKNNFYDLWERNDAFIYAAIRGKFRRGTFQLPQKDYEGEPFFRLIEETVRSETSGSVSVWLVSKKGARFNTSLAPRTRRDLPFQKRVSTALAHFDVDALTRMLDVAMSEADEDNAEAAEDILNGIDLARTRFSRWAVTMAVSNAGSQPLSVLPFAELVVKTQGLVDGQTKMEKDTTIPLEIRDDSGEPTALQIQGGSATLVTFASTNFITDIERSDILTQAYKLGTLSYHVRLFTRGGGFLTRSIIVTKEEDFAPTLSRLSSEPS